MDLYLMRHGEYLHPSVDPEEGLNPRGQAQAVAAGRALARLGVAVDAVLTSTKKRALQTAGLAAAELGFEPGRMEASELVKPMADPADTWKAVADLGCERVLVVGHLPNLARLTGLLIAGGRELPLGFEPTACCLVGVPDPARPSGVLRWFLDPAAMALALD